MSVQLLVGLGNPGAEYAQTRHNAGAWFVQAVAEAHQQTLRLDKKCFGAVATIMHGAQHCRLLIPDTYMNESGRAVAAAARYFSIPAEAVWVAHDELDFAPGIARLKEGGGDGGHNGLRDISKALSSKAYLRLRIGIGHPGHRDAVSDYVLTRPNKADRQAIDDAIIEACRILPLVLDNALPEAMRTLHGPE